MTAIVEQTLNVTVAQIEDALLAGQTVPDFAREWSEPPANVLAVFRRLQREGRIPTNAPTQTATPARTRSLASVSSTTTTAASAPLSVDALVNAAARSESKRTQALGVKLHDVATVIRQRLTEEKDAAEKAEQATRERQAAAAEVERLESMLRDAKAKLRPSRQGGGSVSRPSNGAGGRAVAKKFTGTSPCDKGCGRDLTNAPGPRAKHQKHCAGAS